jgi:hypothetical protein
VAGGFLAATGIPGGAWFLGGAVFWYEREKCGSLRELE